jgi:hypothetical protein
MAADYIAMRLNEWAKDRLRKLDSGTGWASQVPWANGDMPKSGFVQYIPDINTHNDEIEACVVAIYATDRKMFEVIMLAYCELNTTVEQKAKRLGCCVKSFYNYLGQANRLVLGYLNDLACGIKLPKPDYKSDPIKKSA